MYVYIFRRVERTKAKYCTVCVWLYVPVKVLAVYAQLDQLNLQGHSLCCVCNSACALCSDQSFLLALNNTLPFIFSRYASHTVTQRDTSAHTDSRARMSSHTFVYSCYHTYVQYTVLTLTRQGKHSFAAGTSLCVYVSCLLCFFALPKHTIIGIDCKVSLSSSAHHVNRFFGIF